MTTIWHRNATRNRDMLSASLAQGYIKYQSWRRDESAWLVFLEIRSCIGSCRLNYGSIRFKTREKLKCNKSQVVVKIFLWTWLYLCRKNVNSWSSDSFIQENVPALSWVVPSVLITKTTCKLAEPREYIISESKEYTQSMFLPYQNKPMIKFLQIKIHTATLIQLQVFLEQWAEPDKYVHLADDLR